MTSVQKRAEPRSMPLRELTSSTAAPVATVSANLMPPEVIAKRRLSWLKRRLAFALIVLLALVGLGFGLARQQTAGSDDELAAAQAQTSALQRSMGGYADVVRLQGDAAAVRARLAGVMSGDLQWSALLANLGRVAPAGLIVTDVSGNISTDVGSQPGAAPQPGAYSDGSQPAIGTLEVSGNAKDYRSIAAYVDALARVKGFGSVEPGSLGNEAGRSTFTLSISLTKDVLGGRFGTTGGK